MIWPFFIVEQLLVAQSCSASPPSGNLVGGLPLVAHTGEGIEAQRPVPYKSMAWQSLTRAC